MLPADIMIHRMLFRRGIGHIHLFGRNCTGVSDGFMGHHAFGKPLPAGRYRLAAHSVISNIYDTQTHADNFNLYWIFDLQINAKIYF